VDVELGDVVVATAECSRNLAAPRKAAELAALRCRVPPEQAVSWVSLNPYDPRTDVEDHAIAALAGCSLWEFRGAGVRVDPATGAVLHRMDQYFRVIGERCTPAVERRPLIGPVARQRAAAIRDHVHGMAKRLIAVHAETRPRKCWPEASWRALGRLLRHDCELVLLGLPGQALARGGDYLAAPALWAWHDAEQSSFECSVSPVDATRQNIEGLACTLLWQYRRERRESPCANFGRFHPRYQASETIVTTHGRQRLRGRMPRQNNPASASAGARRWPRRADWTRHCRSSRRYR